jgi:hypothetical protein
MPKFGAIYRRIDENFGLGRPMYSAVSPGEYLKSNTIRRKTFKVQRNLEIFIYIGRFFTYIGRICNIFEFGDRLTKNTAFYMPNRW